jgi:hypothetical protein
LEQAERGRISAINEAVASKFFATALVTFLIMINFGNVTQNAVAI